MARWNFYYYVKKRQFTGLIAQSLKLSTSALCRILLLEVFRIFNGHIKENDDLNHFQRKENKSQYLETWYYKL